MKFIVIFSFILAACSSIPQYRKASKSSSISGEGSASEIEADLFRATNNGIAVQIIGYQADAYPYTKAYIQAMGLEKCKKNFESKEICDSKIKQELSEKYEKQSCFFVNIYSRVGIESALDKAWKIKIEQPNEKFKEAKLSHFSSVPQANVTQYYTSFNNSGFACFVDKVDFTEEFKMHIIPQFGGADYKSLLLQWDKPVEIKK